MARWYPLVVVLHAAAAATSTVLLFAYVAHVAHSTDDEDGAVPWVFLLTAFATAALPVAGILWPLRLADAWRTTILLQHTVGIGVACALDDLSAYCVAFAFGFFFTSVITLAHARSLVNYDANGTFGVNSSIIYALLRLVSRLVVRRTTAGPWFTLLFPFLMSSLETMAMYLSGDNRYYAFPSHSRTFVAYALLKATLFLVLPRVEDLLTREYNLQQHIPI